VSLHVFHNGDIDRLLVNCWDPLLSAAKNNETGLPSFFVRYWNGGTHVRIRFHADRLTKDQTCEIRRRLYEYINACPLESSSLSEYHRAAANMAVAESRLRDIAAYVPEAREDLRQDGTIEERDYAFDTARYGGSKTRTLVEGHFCRSSELAMLILSFTMDRLPLRISIALHLCATIFGIPHEPRATTIAMVRKMSEVLSLFSPGAREDIFRAYGFLSFNEQRQALSDLKFQIETGLSVSLHAGLIRDVLDFWQKELLMRYREVVNLRAAGLTQLDPLAFLLDCVHMLNNRLGIPIAVECYLYYLVAAVASECDGST
jgi:hypothetical protein